VLLLFFLQFHLLQFVAHTLYKTDNHLLLPEYSSVEKLRRMLNIAIDNASAYIVCVCVRMNGCICCVQSTTVIAAYHGRLCDANVDVLVGFGML